MTNNTVIEKPNIKEEKLLNPAKGMPLLLGVLVVSIVVILGLFLCINYIDYFGVFGGILIAIAVLYLAVLLPIFCCGFKVINPNEAGVYVLFGDYYGTIAKSGFFWINPFTSMINPAVEESSTTKNVNGVPTTVTLRANKKVSLKAITLINQKQKVNDRDGNPIEVGVVVIWKVVNATKSVFEVDNYKTYVSTQCDASLRQVVRQYPYDFSEDGDEKSLRGSSTEVADEIRRELQARVNLAGVEIIEARISHLAYAQEIAAAMLQRQQADAIIAARQKIVEGAVGMVEMALSKLSEKNIVTLDDERKAAMVSNLLVVLCGNKDAQPIVNSGSIY